jgi:hypothetical protein
MALVESEEKTISYAQAKELLRAYLLDKMKLSKQGIVDGLKSR